MTDTNVKGLITNLPNVLTPEKIAGINAVIQFQLTGQESGVWTITIRDSKCTVEEGMATSPNISVIVDSQVYRNLIEGKINPMAAFMQGKIKISGDMSLLMKLQSIFSAG